MTAPDDRRPDGAQESAAPDAGGPTDPDAIRADIDATREQLEATVDELGHRLDVPARAREGAARARDSAVAFYRANASAVLGGGAAVLAVLAGLVSWRQRRARRRTTRPAAPRAGKRNGKRLAARLGPSVPAPNTTGRHGRKKTRPAAWNKR
jgi:hypothetical protein